MPVIHGYPPASIPAQINLVLQRLAFFDGVMQFGICGLLETFTEPVRKGWNYLEVNVQNFFLPNENLSEFLSVKERTDRERLQTPVACSFLPGTLLAVGPQRDPKRIVKWGQTVFQRAAMTGTSHIVFGSGKSRKRPEGLTIEAGREQFLEVLQALAPLAHDHGVTLVIEPLNRQECNLVNSLADGAALVKACNHPAVQLLADCYHMALEDEPASEIEKYGALIEHVHIAEKEGRTPPGVNGQDFRPYLSALRNIDYQGRISVECKWSNLDRQAPIALSTLREQWAST